MRTLLILVLLNVLLGSGHSLAHCLGVELSAEEERVAQAYLAYYGRPPDEEGLAYWAQRLSRDGGNLQELIGAFGESEEFTRRYADLSNEQLVTALYQQILARDPDPEGLGFYTDQLDSGSNTLQDISLSILDGVRNDDIATVMGRLELSRHYLYAQTVDASNALADTDLADILLRVNAAADSVERACDEVTDLALGQSADDGLPRLSLDSILLDLQPYLAGPHADVLARCVAVEYDEEICTLGQLPFIGMEHAAPSVDDVMNHVVVSHQWMGDNFRALLRIMPQEVRTLLRSVTAVVIDDSLRPSTFYGGTGAMYLDPLNLALTLEQAELIDAGSDYREEAVESLAFLWVSEYLHPQNSPVYEQFYTGEQDLAGLQYEMAPLLFHELAHANDFFPPELLAEFASSDSPALLSTRYESITASVILGEQYPLQNYQLKELATQTFAGEAVDQTLRNLSAAEVGELFEPDAANDLYSYFNSIEDVAMLFEELMMKRHYDAYRVLAFVDLPTADQPQCDDYIVRWGTRSRLGFEQLQDRAHYVLGRIMPGEDLAATLSELQPQLLATGAGYCDIVIADRDRLAAQASVRTRPTTADFRARAVPLAAHDRSAKPSWSKTRLNK